MKWSLIDASWINGFEKYSLGKIERSQVIVDRKRTCKSPCKLWLHLLIRVRTQYWWSVTDTVYLMQRDLFEESFFKLYVLYAFFKISATAIHTRTYQIPSDLWSQAGTGSVSTMVGDHMGILSAVVLFLSFVLNDL